MVKSEEPNEIPKVVSRSIFPYCPLIFNYSVMLLVVNVISDGVSSAGGVLVVSLEVLHATKERLKIHTNNILINLFIFLYSLLNVIFYSSFSLRHFPHGIPFKLLPSK